MKCHVARVALGGFRKGVREDQDLKPFVLVVLVDALEELKFLGVVARVRACALFAPEDAGEESDN